MPSHWPGSRPAPAEAGGARWEAAGSHVRLTAGLGALAVTTRRSSLALLLSFLLLFVQHGAVLHELGHLSHDGSAGAAAQRADLHGSKSAFCLTCEGFAQIANPAAGGVPAIAVLPSGCLPTPDPRYAVIAANTPTPRSRGPPQA